MLWIGTKTKNQIDAINQKMCLIQQNKVYAKRYLARAKKKNVVLQIRSSRMHYGNNHKQNKEDLQLKV